MNDADYITKLGGPSAVARAFGIRPESVTNWKRYGIPQGRKHTLALMYPGKVPKSWLPPGAV